MTPDAVAHAAKAVLNQLAERRKSNVESQKHAIKPRKLINHFNYYGGLSI